MQKRRGLAGSFLPKTAWTAILLGRRSLTKPPPPPPRLLGAWEPVVEVGGIEPPSERPLDQSATCVSECDSATQPRTFYFSLQPDQDTVFFLLHSRCKTRFTRYCDAYRDPRKLRPLGPLHPTLLRGQPFQAAMR